MKTDRAIELAGNAKTLAELLGITPSAISQWGEDVPETRIWQLRVLRPTWFEEDRRIGLPDSGHRTRSDDTTKAGAQ